MREDGATGFKESCLYWTKGANCAVIIRYDGLQSQTVTSVLLDPAAKAAIYSWDISDYLNVTIHNAGLAVWNLKSVGLIKVSY